MDTHTHSQTPERAFLHLCADETWQSGQIECKKERKKLKSGNIRERDGFKSYLWDVA